MMTIEITLDAETETAVLRKAARLGLTPSDYLLRLAKTSVKPRPRHKIAPSPTQEEKLHPLTPAQAVALWREQGVIGSYGDPAMDAPELARALRLEAENRQWE